MKFIGDKDRYKHKKKVYTDDFYLRREQELLSMSKDELSAHFSERDSRLNDWIKSRQELTHLELKKELLTTEEYYQYLKKILAQ